MSRSSGRCLHPGCNDPRTHYNLRLHHYQHARDDPRPDACLLCDAIHYAHSLIGARHADGRLITPTERDRLVEGRAHMNQIFGVFGDQLS